MQLTEAKIRAARAKDKPLKLFDGGGYIFGQPNGGRWWRFKY